MRKGIMAMESMDNEVDGGGDVTEFVDSAESDIIEMDDAANAIESVDQGIDEAADTADTMDAMRGSLEEAAEEGGISEPAAEAVRVAVEHLCARIGLSASKSIFPSMEDFGDKSSRVRATKYTIENLKETAKSIWDAIIKVFNRAIDWIKNFYRSLTDGSIKLKKRAEAIEKKVKELGSKDIKGDGKISTGGFIKQLHREGKMAAGSEFVGKFQVYSVSTNLIKKNLSDFSKSGKDAIAKVMAAVSDEAGSKTAIAEAVKTFKALGEMSEAKSSSNPDFKMDGTTTSELNLWFADKTLYIRVPSGDAAGDGFADSLKDIKVVIAPSSGAKEISEFDKEIAPLGKEEIKKITTLVKKHMDDYKGFQDEIKSIEASRDSIRKGMDKFKSAVGGKDRESQRVAKAYVSVMTAGISSIRGYDIKVCKAALDYCGASLKLTAAPAKEGEKK